MGDRVTVYISQYSPRWFCFYWRDNCFGNSTPLGFWDISRVLSCSYLCTDFSLQIYLLFLVIFSGTARGMRFSKRSLGHTGNSWPTISACSQDIVMMLRPFSAWNTLDHSAMLKGPQVIPEDDTELSRLHQAILRDHMVPELNTGCSLPGIYLNHCSISHFFNHPKLYFFLTVSYI